MSLSLERLKDFYTVKGTQKVFDLLERCQGVKQLEEYHPEGDVFVHSLQTLMWAFRESDDVDLIWAALLHDIGKYENSKGHEQLAVGWLDELVSVKTLWLIEQHMRVWAYINGEMRRLGKCLELAGHPFLPALVQLARWDILGRNPHQLVKYDKKEIIDRFNQTVKNRFKEPEEKESE